jgi:hypothetical protein
VELGGVGVLPYVVFCRRGAGRLLVASFLSIGLLHQVSISLACKWKSWEVACFPRGVQPWAITGVEGLPNPVVSLDGCLFAGLACSMAMVW